MAIRLQRMILHIQGRNPGCFIIWSDQYENHFLRCPHSDKFLSRALSEGFFFFFFFPECVFLSLKMNDWCAVAGSKNQNRGILWMCALQHSRTTRFVSFYFIKAQITWLFVTVSYFPNISMVCKVCSSYLSDRRWSRLELLDHVGVEQIKPWIV